MSRFDRRVSRPLIAILGVIVCLGAGSIIYKLNHPSHKSGQAIAPPPEAAIAAAATGDLPKPAPRPAAALVDKPIPPVAVNVAKNIRIEPAQEKPAQERPAQQKLVDDSTLVKSAILSSEIARPATMPSATVMSMAKSDLDAGRLLEARSRLNEALQSNPDSPQAAQIKSMMSQINQTLVFSRQRVSGDPYSGGYPVQRGDTFQKIGHQSDTTAELLESINGLTAKSLRAGSTIKIIQGPFFAVVNKTTFKMDIYLGGLPPEQSSMYVTTYDVGLGRDDSTPVGTWMIEAQDKLRNPTYYSPRGQGVIAADDPKNPLGGYWIGLKGTGGEAVGKMSYGIHGTIEPESIGKQSSMGCIRLRKEDIAMVYDLLVAGKSVVEVKK